MTKRALSGDVNIDEQVAYIDFEVDEENTLRLVVPEDHMPRLKLAIQQLQQTASDKRRERGLPVLQRTIVANVKDIEFGKDDIQKLALLRTHLETGEVQETPLSVDMIRSVLGFLETTLAEFESKGPTPH